MEQLLCIQNHNNIFMKQIYNSLKSPVSFQECLDQVLFWDRDCTHPEGDARARHAAHISIDKLQV